MMKHALLKKYWNTTSIKIRLISLYCILSSLLSFSQVTTQVDTTKIRIGEQINYKIKVTVDSTKLVVFPEGQNFMPFENVEASAIDTSKNDSKFELSKYYKLTHFDSGHYTIPRQKIIIEKQAVFTDSIQIEVNTVAVDTTKQKLYDIKPILEVDKTKNNSWLYVVLISLILLLIATILYWFVWRKKPLSEAEKIALLPPYERAKLALKKLDESDLLKQSKIKEYYSELTLAIRNYLDEKVYDRALESTTDELINHLELLKAGNQLAINKDSINHIETILKRADLVKFAKSAPEIALIKIDRDTIEKEIDKIKAVLPQPNEEEKRLNENYRAEQDKKRKRKKMLLISVCIISLIALTYIGLGAKYSFTKVNDTITFNKSKRLLDGEWVNSVYGFPTVYISTPKVLQRIEDSLSKATNNAFKQTVFSFNEAKRISTSIITTQALSNDNKLTQENIESNISQSIEQILKEWETQEVQNIITQSKQHTTPNGVEGAKSFGTADFPTGNSNEYTKSEYAIFSFATEQAIVQIIMTWASEDIYAIEMAKRIIESIELKSDEQAKAEQEQQQ